MTSPADGLTDLPPRSANLKSTEEPFSRNSAPHIDPAWSESFRDLRSEKSRVVVHRAAASGKLSDVAAARWQRQFCSKFSKDGEVLISLGMTNQTTQIAYFKKMQDNCFADSVQSTLVVRDDQGFGKSAGPLVEAAAGNAITDAGIRRELLKRVLQTKSLDLLAAVSRRVLVKEDIYELGLQPSEQVDGTTDEIMLDMAIQIDACSQRGDCDKVAVENIDCELYKSCVADLRNFPNQRIFGEAADRTFFVQMAKTQDSSVLRARWNVVNAFIEQLRRGQ